MRRAWMVDAAGGMALAALLGAGYLVGVRSNIEARATERAARAELDALRGERAAIEGDLRLLEEDLAGARERASRGVRLRGEDERNSVLAEVSRIAGDAGLVVDELVPGELEEVEGLVRLSIALRARGGAEGVVRMEGLLREGLAGVTIRTLEIAGDPFSDSEDRAVSIGLSWLSDRAEGAVSESP